MLEGLNEPDDVIRARTAHALERISRTNPEMIQVLTPQLIKLVLEDRVPMAKWHLAMILGNLTLPEEETNTIVSALFSLLEDESTFVKSRAIVSLCLIGKRDRDKRNKIIERLGPLRGDQSIAIRSKAAKALRVLENEVEPLPAGWAKAGNP